MPLKVTAFAPANISLVFETYAAEPPHGRGSLGAGITLTQGVEVTASRSAAARTEIVVGGEEWEFPTVRAVADGLSPVPLRLEITAAFPFGCGFGMSGAGALAAAYAIDALLETGLPRETLGMAAHRAEVACATGLGDVGGQFNGGVMVKTRKFEPLTVERLTIPRETLHYRIFGPIMTSQVINSPEKLRLINAAGHAALREISERRESLTMAGLFDLSRDFAEASGLLQSEAVRRSIADAARAGGSATMIMLGEAVISTVPFPGSAPVEILADATGDPVKTRFVSAP